MSMLPIVAYCPICKHAMHEGSESLRWRKGWAHADCVRERRSLESSDTEGDELYPENEVTEDEQQAYDAAKAESADREEQHDDGAPERLAIDAKGYGWRIYDTHWSMIPVNPDNAPIPQPVTYYVKDTQSADICPTCGSPKNAPGWIMGDDSDALSLKADPCTDTFHESSDTEVGSG